MPSTVNSWPTPKPLRPHAMRRIREGTAGRLKNPARSTARCWMGGDNYEADICGGAAFGLRTIWVVSEPVPGSTNADHCVETIADALDILLHRPEIDG